MKLLVTTPSGIKIDLFRPKPDQINFEDITAQLAAIDLYGLQEGEIIRKYTALHRCMNIMKYFTTCGLDRRHIFSAAGQMFGPSYCLLLPAEQIHRYEITTTSCGNLYVMDQAVKNRFNMSYHLTRDFGRYYDQILEWETATMMPRFQRESAYLYDRSAAEGLHTFNTEVPTLQAEFYDQIQFLHRRING